MSGVGIDGDGAAIGKFKDALKIAEGIIDRARRALVNDRQEGVGNVLTTFTGNNSQIVRDKLSRTLEGMANLTSRYREGSLPIKPLDEISLAALSKEQADEVTIAVYRKDRTINVSREACGHMSADQLVIALLHEVSHGTGTEDNTYADRSPCQTKIRINDIVNLALRSPHSATQNADSVVAIVLSLADLEANPSSSMQAELAKLASMDEQARSTSAEHIAIGMQGEIRKLGSRALPPVPNDASNHSKGLLGGNPSTKRGDTPSATDGPHSGNTSCQDRHPPGSGGQVKVAQGQLRP